MNKYPVSGYDLFISLRQYRRIWLIPVFILLATAFRNKENTQNSLMRIHFTAYVHGEPLQFNKDYSNLFGEIFRIRIFRFYIGKIKPVYMDEHLNRNPATSYFLVDFSDTAGRTIEVPASAGLCSELGFQIGIDSADQVRGAQTGVLDPVKGMYWTWNSGYLSFKLEGSSPVSGEPAHLMAYHIGGYRFPYSTVSQIRFLPEKTIMVSSDKTVDIEIPVELDHFFNGVYPVHIRETADCTTPGELARKLAVNFAAVFSTVNTGRKP